MEWNWRKNSEVVEVVEDQPHGASKILSTQLLNPNSARKRILTRFENVFSLTLNFLLRVGSEKVINVEIPTLDIGNEVDIEDVTVDTPIILTPSKFLYFVDDIPLISITSPSSNS